MVKVSMDLLSLTAVGCADLRLLKDAWIRRTKNEVIVGCNSTSQTWHMRCQGNQWIGVIGNCTQRKNCSLTTTCMLEPGFKITSYYSSFIHSGHLYSASSNPPLLRGVPNYSIGYCVGVNTPKRYRHLRVKDLPKVLKWRPKLD